MSGHYVFNASAIGFGGVLTSPKRKVIPSLASVALAPSGGEGVGLVTNYNEGDGISFDRAETRVFGSANGKGDYATRADVLVNNLNVFNQLTIESMWATVTSIRHVEVNEDEGTFTVTDKRFTFQAEYLGVRINGEPLDIPVDTKIFDDNPSYDGFVKAICADEMADYRKLIGLGDKQTSALVRSPRGADDANPNMICCTAVSTKCQAGFHVPVKGVGRAHLGEVLVKHGRRRLTLLRLEFAPDALDIRPTGPMLQGKDGGADNGSGTVGSVEGNGSYTLP